MQGRPSKADHIRETLLRAITSAEKLFCSVQQVAGIRGTANSPRLHTEHVRRVFELAFMGVAASWEEFLEASMVRYMAGARCNSGYAPSLRIGKCAGIDHAYQVLAARSDHDPSKDYLTWTSPTAVVNRAKLFFDAGRPYADPITNSSRLLTDAAKIRNRVAHASTKCRHDFLAVARFHLGKPIGAKLVQGYRVGDLLASNAVSQFPRAARGRSTVFEAYMNLYRNLAQRIVP